MNYTPETVFNRLALAVRVIAYGAAVGIAYLLARVL